MDNFCRFDFFLAREKVNSHVVCTWQSIVRRNDIQKKMICETNDVAREFQCDIIVFIVISGKLSGHDR